jgi:hypothetical protein
VIRRWIWPLLLVAACTEQSTAPGVCPNFCPGGAINIQDTIFTSIINRDSSYSGYVPNYSAEAMSAIDLPGIVDSRAFVTFDTMGRRVRAKVGDTTTVPITVDSVRVRMTIVNRPKREPNLRLKLYHLPVTVDSTSDFASLDPYFTSPVVDSLNVSTLLARPAIGDTQTIRLWGDSIRVDSAGNVLQINRSDSSLTVYFLLDTLQAPLVAADTGRLAYGIRVGADSFPSVTLATLETASPPQVRWFYHYLGPDTVLTKTDTIVLYSNRTVGPRFDSFVFSPPTPPLDSNLAVGGVPSVRSLLRVALPAFMHDSIDVVRATLILVPVKAVPGVPSDSFRILARPVLADLAGKSPLGTTTTLFGSTYIHIGSPDTVRIELTNMVRAWTMDTTQVTAFILGEVPEATSYTQIRFYSTRTPALRPLLQVTYVHRFQFGVP